jgi:hypothetical protein
MLTQQFKIDNKYIQITIDKDLIQAYMVKLILRISKIIT